MISATTITVLLVMPVEGAADACAEPVANCMRTLSDSVYWTITTMTTTGYGDITPKTALVAPGQWH